MFQIDTAAGADASAIDTLLDTCFGPARHARTAYRLRDGVAAIPELSLVARGAEGVVASIQLWPLQLRSGLRVHALTLLGPLVVSPAHRCEGLGSALMDEALARADASGAAPVLLIGDAPYYARFGFSAAATAGWVVPGPVERDRLLLRGGAGLPGYGVLEPAGLARRLAAA